MRRIGLRPRLPPHGCAVRPKPADLPVMQATTFDLASTSKPQWYSD